MIGGILFVLAAASACWTLARWLLSLLPGGGQAIGTYWRELAAVAGGLFIFGLAMSLLSRLTVGDHRRNLFADMSQALRRIARGDFDVSLAVPGRNKDDPFGGLAGDLNEMARSLKRMEELRQEFVSTVSHDIQSPLASIAGFARALRDEELPAETRRHYLGIIEEESGRLSRLSAALLSLSALEARPPAPASYRLDEQLRGAVLAAEPQWRAKGLELDLDLEELRIVADGDMLGQAWANLLHNALKFSPPGGRVALRLRGEGGAAVFRIEDQGIGIEEADLPRVFDRFFKADRSRSRADPASGSGLGLAIVKKVAELHGGSVAAESGGPGRGSAFTVTLPLSPG